MEINITNERKERLGKLTRAEFFEKENISCEKCKESIPTKDFDIVEMFGFGCRHFKQSENIFPNSNYYQIKEEKNNEKN